MTGFWLLLALLAAAGGLVYRSRLRARTGELTDDTIRRIEEGGAIELDEPLDFEEIADEEERFWETEPWEEADDY